LTTYVSELREMLAEGVEGVSSGLRDRVSGWLVSGQRADGGFAGPRGASDLYYAGFASRLAGILGLTEARFWDGLWKFLYQSQRAVRDIPEAVSALLLKRELDGVGRKACCPGSERLFIEGALLAVEGFRCADGGYSKTRGGPASAYHTFLAALCFELAERPMPGTEGIGEVLGGHRGPGGGYSDVVVGEASAVEGTNATAAVVSLLSMFGRLDGETAEGAQAFLRSQQRADEGFAATPTAPMADLMSTFTGLLTLVRLGGASSVKLGGVGRYVKSLVLADGSFGASIGDRTGDVEYGYYGLGTLSLLAREVARVRRAHAC